MRRTVKGDVGPDDGSIADADLARVEHYAVEVDEDVAADVEVEAVVDGDRRFDPGVCVEDGIVFFGRGCWGREGSEVACYPNRGV